MKIGSYNIFVIHNWDYNDQYKDLIAMINKFHFFHYRNYSSPQNNPLVSPSIYSYPWLFLKQKIKPRIKHAHIVLVIAGTHYDSRKYRDWMQTELEITLKYNKPLIAICPLGQEAIPQEIQAVATAVVNWDSLSIINTIRSND
jgi:hypothetical protein